METILLRKPEYIFKSDTFQTEWQPIDTSGSGVPFGNGDLVALNAGQGWAKADAAQATAATLLAAAMDYSRDDVYQVPIGGPTGGGTIIGKNPFTHFRVASLDNVQIVLNVNAGTLLTAAMVGDGNAYDLAYDAPSGVMTVDVGSTANGAFYIDRLFDDSNASATKSGVLGDSQVRVVGRIISARVWSTLSQGGQ